LTTEPLHSPTLADVIHRITADHSLKLRRRRHLRWAIRFVARSLGKQPDELPAEIELIKELAWRNMPILMRRAPERWAGIIRAVGAALVLAGYAERSNARRYRLSPAWHRLWLKIRASKSKLSRCLPRLMNYCTAQNIGPQQVDDGTIEAYANTLALRHGDVYARKAQREVCGAWNCAVERVPEWPQRRMQKPCHGRRWSLPWDSFPTSLKSDADAWLERLARGDPLGADPVRPARPWTRQTYALVIHQFASALVHRGRDPQQLRSLSDLVGLETVKEGLRYFLARDKKVSDSWLKTVLCVLSVIARNWVKIDAWHLEELSALRRNLVRLRIELGPRSRARLRAFDDPANMDALLTLPECLIEDASRNDTGARKWANRVEVAVAIELLIFCPIRIGVLHRLELDRHVQAMKTAAGTTMRVVVPSRTALGARDLIFVLPDRPSRLIFGYIERFRTRLLRGPSRWLFPGRDAHPKSSNRLGGMIRDTIRETIGLEVTSLLFRHIGAKVFLGQFPGSYEVLRRILGHRSVSTTTKLYGHFSTPAALRAFDERVLKMSVAVTPATATRQNSDVNLDPPLMTIP